MYIHLDLSYGNATYKCSNGDVYTNTKNRSWRHTFLKLVKNSNQDILEYIHLSKFLIFGTRSRTFKFHQKGEVINIEIETVNLFRGYFIFRVKNDTYTFVYQTNYDMSIHKNDVQVGYRSPRSDKFNSRQVRIRYDHNIETDIVVALDFTVLLVEQNLYTSHKNLSMGTITFGERYLEGDINWFNK